MNELREVLNKTQWKRSWDGTVVYCRVCGMGKADGHADDCVFTALATALERLDKQQDDLLRLTPGGSEFVGDWKRCLEFVSDRMATVGKLAKRAKALEDALATALERLEEYQESFDQQNHDHGETILELNKAERRLRGYEQAIEDFIEYADQSDNPSLDDSEWSDGYRQAWASAKQVLSGKIAALNYPDGEEADDERA